MSPPFEYFLPRAFWKERPTSRLHVREGFISGTNVPLYTPYIAAEYFGG